MKTPANTPLRNLFDMADSPRGLPPPHLEGCLVDTNRALTIKPCDLKTRQLSAIAREEKAKRDAAIVEAYLRCGTIHDTRKVFDFTHSREVIRKAISKAGVYDKCKRDQVLIKRMESRKMTCKTSVYQVSKRFKTEMRMQYYIAEQLKKSSIQFERETQIKGCQMRADFVGTNWAIETKKSCTSQCMLTAMAQCQVYRKHLNKRNVCILIPDDIEPGSFYVSECLSHGIPVIKMSQLVSWIKTVQGDAQSN